MSLGQKEQSLYHTVIECWNKADQLLEEANRRNTERVAEERSIFRKSNALKRMISYGIFGAAAFAAFLFYKSLGMF